MLMLTSWKLLLIPSECLFYVYVSLLEGFYDWDSDVFNSVPIDNRFVVAKICSLIWAFPLRDDFQPSS